MKKSRDKGRGNVGGKADELSRWSHGGGEKEWESEEGEIGFGPLKKMIEVCWPNHEGGRDELKEEGRDDFKLK